LVRDVRDAADEILQLGLQGGELPLGGLELAFRRLGLLQKRGRVVTLALRLSDLLGNAVARRLRLLDARLQRLAGRLEPLEFHGIELRAAACAEALGDLLRILPQELEVDHRLRAASSSARSSVSLSRIFCSRPRSLGRYQSWGAMPSGR